MVLRFLCLDCSSEHHSFQFPSCYHKRQILLLQWSNGGLWLHVPPFISLSSGDGHLGQLPFLDIFSDVTMSMGE